MIYGSSLLTVRDDGGFARSRFQDRGFKKRRPRQTDIEIGLVNGGGAKNWK